MTSGQEVFGAKSKFRGVMSEFQLVSCIRGGICKKKTAAFPPNCAMPRDM
jgi:hypothetical protein